MKRSTRNAVLLAALFLPAAVVQAQYRIDNSQARDANNRIGSGGFNVGTGTQLNGRINGLAGNYIVTGNVTGGRAFRGSLGYTDPTAFRGSLGSASFDSYLRDSIGASQMRGMGNAATSATIRPEPFFGQSSVAPPSGFARDPASGSFYLPRTSPGVVAADGRIDYGGATRSDIQQGVLSTQRVTGGAGLLTTPVTGLNQREQLTNVNRISDFTALTRAPISNLNADLSAADETLTGPRRPQAEPQERPAATSGDETTATPDSVSLTGQGTVYKNLRALDNNSQYAELRRRLDEKSARPKLPGSEAVESLNRINADILAGREKEREAAKPAERESPRNPTNPANPTDPAPGAAPANPGARQSMPEVPAAPQDNLNLPRPAAGPAVTPPTAPLEINSLASGVKDQNLGKVLSEAEAAMKEGKFSSAIDAFERAEEMAADDPLVFVGRAIAELGGGYYRSAEVHFRQAFAADPALLLAKFDLRSMLTDQRLNTLQVDLAQIAKKNEKDSGPLLLLAFIYYNSGFPERAERALEMVQERAGGQDNEAKLLKEAWFPASGTKPTEQPAEQSK